MGGTSDFDGCLTHGPWGGSEGKKWVYMPQVSIEKIIVQHETAVESIKFQTPCSKGEPKISLFGDKDIQCGSKVSTISIDCPKEYLMSISGTFGSEGANVVVKSICFMTNLNLYGPYGVDQGTTFSYEVKDEAIVGFHGRARTCYLAAIGVYALPKSSVSRPTCIYEGKIKNELCCTMKVTRDAGPWGAGGGKPWDDGVNSTVKQVRVHSGELNVIYAIQFEYLKSDAKSVLSEIHGGTDGSIIELVHLDVNDEYLIGVTGFYGPVKGYNGLEAIVSISFHSNKRIYGPFGEERGKGNVYFTSSSSGKVVGFHGRTNGFLSAIGVLMEYF